MCYSGAGTKPDLLSATHLDVLRAGPITTYGYGLRRRAVLQSVSHLTVRTDRYLDRPPAAQVGSSGPPQLALVPCWSPAGGQPVASRRQVTSQ